jgi:predicted nucleic acid-binding protein
LTAYLDSSFLVSLYSPDVNTAASVRSFQTATGSLLITTFTELEVLNAFELRVFRKDDQPEKAELSITHFEMDLRMGALLLRSLPENVFVRAKRLSRETTAQTGTRAGDLLHVAAALELGADAFYSFDLRQRKLAQAVKLKLNPL